jgi:hypothetical protein
MSLSRLDKRFLSTLGNFIADAASVAVSTIFETGKSILSGVATVAQLAVGAIVVLAKVAVALVKFIATGAAQASTEFDIGIAPPNVGLDPFSYEATGGDFTSFFPIYVTKDADAATDGTLSVVQQFSNLLTTGDPKASAGNFGIYCGDCGVSGKIGISGSITASPANGVTEARLGVGGESAVLSFSCQDLCRFVFTHVY